MLAAACDRWSPPSADEIAGCDDDDAPVWSWPLLASPDGRANTLAEHDGVIFVAANGMFELAGQAFGADGFANVLAALSADDGAMRWAIETDQVAGDRPHGVAVAPGGALFSLLNADGAFSLRRHDPVDDAVVWTSAVGERTTVFAAGDTTVATLTRKDDEDRLSAFDAATGALLWSIKRSQWTSQIVSLAITGNGDVAAAQDWDNGVVRSAMWVFSRATGEIVWSHGEISLGEKVATADDGDVVLFTRESPGRDVSAELTRFAPDGTIRWSRTLDSTSPTRAMNVAGDDLVIVGSSTTFDGVVVDGGDQCNVVAHLSAATGEDVSLLEYCDCQLRTDIVVDDAGRLYVRDSRVHDGEVAAYDPHASPTDDSGS